jgi:hypothetical protein
MWRDEVKEPALRRGRKIKTAPSLWVAQQRARRLNSEARRGIAAPRKTP